MKRLLIIAVFLLTTAGVGMADYDYYTKREPPQNCKEVLDWEIAIIQERIVLSRINAEISIQRLKPGDNELNFHKKQEWETKSSMLTDEYNAMKEAKDRLCEKK